MLRVHCLQLWFNLSAPAVEEPVYEPRAMHALEKSVAGAAAPARIGTTE
jgi:hypothetical protein